ncbi:flagellar export chaperone FlgN [Microbacteriaceae bacterium 4G12]
MYESIYAKLSEINTCYQEIHRLGEEIYELLKEKKVQATQSLNTLQLQKIEQLKGLQTALGNTIHTYCKEKQVQPAKIKSLLPLFTEKEADHLKTMQQQVVEIEAETRKILLQNQYYVTVLLKTTESMIDCISELNLERNHNSQIFMNELL